PTAPGVAQAAASLRMRRLYSAPYVRRRALATTCTSSTIGAAPCPSMGLPSLALYSNFGGGHCLTDPDTEGTAKCDFTTGLLRSAEMTNVLSFATPRG